VSYCIVVGRGDFALIFCGWVHQFEKSRWLDKVQTVMLNVLDFSDARLSSMERCRMGGIFG
jgi:hypothetical protein